MEDESVREELRTFIQNKWNALQEWLKPNPDDSIAIQILKSIYKSLAVLVLIALSPVILLLLLIAFIGVL